MGCKECFDNKSGLPCADPVEMHQLRTALAAANERAGKLAEYNGELLSQADQLRAEVEQLKEDDAAHETMLAERRNQVAHERGAARRALERIESLTAEVERLRFAPDTVRGDNHAQGYALQARKWLERAEHMEAERDALRAALKRYGRHLDGNTDADCAKWDWFNDDYILHDDRPCTCGLDAALAGGEW